MLLRIPQPGYVLEVTGEPGELAQLIRLVGSAAVVPSPRAAPAPAKVATAIAKQPRPKCPICDRNHAKGNCREMGRAAIKKAVAS